MNSAAPNEPVLLRRDEGQVAILTLNRPRAMNALSGDLIDALQAEFDKLAKDREIRCVVIDAKGDRAFSTGHDLREVAAGHTFMLEDYKLQPGDQVCVLDERGTQVSSAELSELLKAHEMRGTKRLVAGEYTVLVAKGRSDGRTVVIVPEIKDGQPTGLVLLHVRLVDELDRAPDADVVALQWKLADWGGLRAALPREFPGNEFYFQPADMVSQTLNFGLSAPIDIQIQDTYYVVAHFHYVMVAGSLFAFFGGIYYWFPKATGRRMNDVLGRIHFWGSFVCMNVIFMPMFIQGLGGMNRRMYDGGLTFQHNASLLQWNIVIGIAAWVMGLVQVPFIINVFTSMFSGKKVESDNPWEATTLEWTLPSPPDFHSYEKLPVFKEAAHH